ncbi:MAG TPA: hypothetical protein VEQ17_10105 [Steroidobacteraceae bacterium]|nr:hypothetical protein [Steroidobacteraceae bacterium]
MNKKNCAFLVPAALLVACASEPAPRPAPAPAPVSLTKVYFYPLQGQSGAQQDRDRYECFNWSVRQTGFDPSRRVAPGEQRATVVPARSAGQTIATTAAVGAAIGAVAAGPYDAAEGAVVGAVAGGFVGAVAAAADQAQAQQAVQVHDDRGGTHHAQQAGEYRRAMSACLEGRGYSVK